VLLFPACATAFDPKGQKDLRNSATKAFACLAIPRVEDPNAVRFGGCVSERRSSGTE